MSTISIDLTPDQEQRICAALGSSLRLGSGPGPRFANQQTRVATLEEVRSYLVSQLSAVVQRAEAAPVAPSVAPLGLS